MLFRVVVVIGENILLYSSWFFCNEWTVEEVINLKRDPQLKGSNWYLEYNNIK